MLCFELNANVAVASSYRSCLSVLQTLLTRLEMLSYLISDLYTLYANTLLFTERF